MLPSDFSKWMSASELEVNWEEVNGGRIPLLVKVESEELFTLSWIKSSPVPSSTLHDEARPALYCEAPSANTEPLSLDWNLIWAVLQEALKYQLIWFTAQPGPINMFALSDKNEFQGERGEISSNSSIFSYHLTPFVLGSVWGRQSAGTWAALVGSRTGGGISVSRWHVWAPGYLSREAAHTLGPVTPRRQRHTTPYLRLHCRPSYAHGWTTDPHTWVSSTFLVP